MDKNNTAKEDKISMDDSAKLQFAFKVISLKLDRQNHAANAIETKVGVLLALIGTLVAASIPFLKQNPQFIGENFFTLGIIGIYVSLTFLFLAARTRAHVDPPDYSTVLSSQAWLQTTFEYKNQIVADMQEAHKINTETQNKVAAHYDTALRLLWISVTLLLVTVFIK